MKSSWSSHQINQNVGNRVVVLTGAGDAFIDRIDAEGFDFFSPRGYPNSEVSLTVEAHEKLVAEGIRSRVVSMPSWDIFEHQTQEYQDEVLPPHVTARVAVEQASTFGWERYIDSSGLIIGMKTFGASAPLKELQRKFGFEPNRVVTAAKELLGRN
jgi:hypothetical protein